jgi:hypothetical protein
VCPFDVRWCSTFHENTWNCHNPQNQFTQTTNTWNMWNRRYCVVSSGFRRSTRSPVMERPIWIMFSTAKPPWNTWNTLSHGRGMRDELCSQFESIYREDGESMIHRIELEMAVELNWPDAIQQLEVWCNAPDFPIYHRRGARRARLRCREPR